MPYTYDSRLRDDFGGTSIDATKWQTGLGQSTGVFSRTGTGMAFSVTGSELAITTGVTSGDEIVFRSVQSWKADNLRAEFQLRLSQRIANQEFKVRLANAAGTSYVEWTFDGTTATTQKTQSGQGGSTWTANATSVPTTVTNPPTWDWGLCLRRGVASWTYRQIHLATQVLNVYAERGRWFPLPDEDVYVEIRAKNTGTAASTTTFAVDVVHIQHDDPVGVTIEGGSGDTSLARATPVYLSGYATGSTVLGLTNAAASSTNGGTSARILTTVSNNLTSVKASAGRVHSLHLHNSTASAKFFKLYNKASAPVVASDTPIMTVIIPANLGVQIEPPLGIQCSTGIAYAITGAQGDTDATNTAAGDVTGALTYT